jgi:transcriptional regulator with XRE-family HTH domain
VSQLLEELREEFQNEESRYDYAEAHLNASVASQIKRFRGEMSQQQLAEKIGTKQSGISRLENANYSAWKVETLRKLARAFHLRLKITFEEFGSLVPEIENFEADTLTKRKFEDDPAFYEGTAEKASAANALHQLAHGRVLLAHGAANPFLGGNDWSTDGTPATLIGLANAGQQKQMTQSLPTRLPPSTVHGEKILDFSAGKNCLTRKKCLRVCPQQSTCPSRSASMPDENTPEEQSRLMGTDVMEMDWVPPSPVPEVYINHVTMGMSLWDISIHCGVIAGFRDGRLKAAERIVLHLSPEMAKALESFLSQATAQYEQTFGKIRFPNANVAIGSKQKPEPEKTEGS